MEKVSEEEKKKIIGDAYNIAHNFAKDVFKKFPGLVKSIVLYGSVSKENVTRQSDVDILILVDDTLMKPTKEFIDWYNLELMLIMKRHSSKIHVNTVTLTTFWDNVRVGEPVVINVLRSGIPLIDTGFFEPIQLLLKAGKIRPSQEAIFNAWMRSPAHFIRANAKMISCVIDYYWVVIDAAHAALMAYGQVPPSPEHVEKYLIETFVDKKLLDKKYANYFKEIWKISKSIIHGELVRISGVDVENYRRMAEDFYNQMKKLLESKKLI